ncbi:MAG: hypothetical protein RLZZ574_120 [Cyanobacteriota bacterium]|jgi:hypothetical protein
MQKQTPGLKLRFARFTKLIRGSSTMINLSVTLLFNIKTVKEFLDS